MPTKGFSPDVTGGGRAVPIVLIVAGVLLLLVAVSRPAAGPRAPVAEEVAIVGPAMEEPRDGAAGATTTTAPAGHPHEEGAYPGRPPAGVEPGYVANVSEMARSDLAPAVFREVTAVGVAVLRADVTGVGRERWPGFWPEGPYRPCCRDVVVLAAGARGDGAGRVLVRILWSAQRLVGAPEGPRETQLPLVQRSGGWWPA